MEYMLMPLRRYADFSGRSRRMEYWMFVLFQIIIYTVLVAAMFAVAGTTLVGLGEGANPLAAGASVLIFFLLLGLLWLVLLIPSMAVAVRRLHDTNRSGWWFGFYILAYLGLNVLSTLFMTAAATSPESAMSFVGVFGILGIGLLIYGLVLLVFFFLDGTPGPNRYGPDPKGRADASNVFA